MIYYYIIFQNEITSLKNMSNEKKKIKLSHELQSRLDDAYLTVKIDKEHYNL